MAILARVLPNSKPGVLTAVDYKEAITGFAIYLVDTVPSAGAGTAAPLGSIAVYKTSTAATMYLKNGLADTAWVAVTTA